MSDFVVRPFAFMRLTHEALRSGYLSLASVAEEGDLKAVRQELAALRGVIDLHARQEEEVFFPMLDRLFDGATRDGGLREAHEREEAHQARLDAALAADDVEGVRGAIAEWGPSFEQHLAEEEAVMMPLTELVADTVEGRASAVREIVELDWEMLRTTHLPYVVKSLNDHKPYGPLRMFVAALQSATNERFAELEPIVRASVSDEKATMLQTHGHLS